MGIDTIEAIFQGGEMRAISTIRQENNAALPAGKGLYVSAAFF
ncbi:hypothetical protein D1AOALGA4SA_11640 [Olavius algarvensis Delta 1 endosymbiont]|nr:hypothetical protein D1AOALGA4SA_11640 [Olavius algarvensis Delta 1 endosymbiont]